MIFYIGFFPIDSPIGYHIGSPIGSPIQALWIYCSITLLNYLDFQSVDFERT
jgi:hypothetical protein